MAAYPHRLCLTFGDTGDMPKGGICMYPRGKAQSPVQHPGATAPRVLPHPRTPHRVLLSSCTLRAAALHANQGRPQEVPFQAFLFPQFPNLQFLKMISKTGVNRRVSYC